MNDDKTVDDWADSFDVTSDSSPVEAPEEKELDDEQNEPEENREEESPAETDQEDEKPDEGEGPSDAPEEGSGDAEKDGEGAEAPGDGKPDAPKPETDEPAPGLTRDDIKAALKEAEVERYGYVEEIKNTSNDVLEAFYPEGIDRTLRDADGEPITSIDDVMDRINPRTGENFTEEQAASWLLSEQQKLNRQIEELEASAERVAEVNVGLKNDAIRVAEKYADALVADPAKAEKVRQLYENSLRKDPKTGITLEAPVPLEDFYDTFFGSNPAPLPTPAEQEPEKPKRQPGDRADLPPTNGNDNLSKEDREWAEIAKEYQSQRN